VRLDVKQAVASYVALRAANARTLYAMRGASAAFIAFGKVSTAAGLLLGAAFYKSVKAAAAFERQLDFFGAVTNSTEAQMEKVRAKALQLGQDTIFSAGQIADSFVELGKAGVTSDQIINGVADAVAHLGAAADIPLATAAQIMTAAVQTFDLKAQDAVHVADLLAGSANASIVEVEDLGVSLKYVGGVAHAVSIPIEDVIDALSLLGKAGIRGSTAGTSLRQIIVSLTGTSKKAEGVLQDLGIITDKGANKFFTAEGKAKSLSRIFQILQSHTKDLSEEQRLAAFKTIFQNRALAAANILTKAGAKGFKSMNKEISKTTAADVSAKRLDNLSGDIEILRGNIETLMIKAGTPFQNFLRGIVQNVTKLVQAFANLSPETQLLVFKIVAAAAAFLLVQGVVSLFIGTVLRSFRAVKLLTSAITFLFDILKAFALAFRALSVLMVSTPFGLVVLAIIALVAAFIIAYKKSETFRNIVNGVLKSVLAAFKAFWNWIQGLPAFFVGVWNAIKNAFVATWNAIISFFTALPGRLAALAKAAVMGVVNFFRQLPYYIGFALGLVLGLIVRLMFKIIVTMANLADKAVRGTINFFVKLPGRLLNIFLTTLRFIWNTMKKIVQVTISLAKAAFFGIIDFFVKLPGRLWNLFVLAQQKIHNAMVNIKDMAIRLAKAILKGIHDAIVGLPHVVSQIFHNALDALGKLVSGAWKAGKKFGKGLWDGFKKGVGIGSPSFIERAMWQITDVLDKESKRMPGLVSRIQSQGTKLNKTQFSPQVAAGLSATSSSTLRQLAAAQKVTAKLARQRDASITPVRDLARAGIVRDARGGVVNNHHEGDNVAITINNPARTRPELSTERALTQVAYRKGYRR
jgi:TP901 family phage tail tape measure protein